jgi:hypothetical protein
LEVLGMIRMVVVSRLPVVLDRCPRCVLLLQLLGSLRSLKVDDLYQAPALALGVSM